MWRIYDCLVYQHDFRLMPIAAAICLFGTIATFTIYGRTARTGRQRATWLALAAICAGGSVWSTHFVAILAFRDSLPISFALGPTLNSLAAGVMLAGLGLMVAARPGPGRLYPMLGGTILGAGVSALHFIGMSALQLPGHITYDADLAFLAVALSLVFGAASTTLYFEQNKRLHHAARVCFFLMVVTLHFIGMSAVRIELGMWDVNAAQLISRETLAILVSAVTICFIAISMAAALFDRRRSDDLERQARRFRLLSDKALEGLLVHRDGMLVDHNAAARRLLALDEAEGNVIVADLFSATGAAQAQAQPLDTFESLVEGEMRSLDGRVFPVEFSSRLHELEDGSAGHILAFRDVSARKLAEARLHHHALHDPLTDLPNRRLFNELAEKVLAESRRSGTRFAVFAIDIDDFKLLNDLHGRATGDRLLSDVAQRITGSLRSTDILARLDGDEFAIIETGCDQPRDAAVLAARLRQEIATPFAIEAGEVGLSASIGIAVYPSDGASITELLRNAETAKVRAQAQGKGSVLFFEPSMNAALEARRRLESRLRRAIEQDLIAVHYQPIANTHNFRVEGFESLCRWTDEELGPVSPADFIPVAEETGLIIDLGALVLRKACAEATRWPRHLRVAVNMSAVQFRQRGLVQLIERILRETGLEGERLELEITESTLIDDRERVLEILRRLRELGIRIAMDDFGTGFSSLSYLQSFPFDKLKIDQSFVGRIDEDSRNVSIIRAIAAMGHSLQMRVVAEGVETEHQARIIRKLACDELQGYLVARPMPAEEIESFLRTNTGKPGTRREVA